MRYFLLIIEAVSIKVYLPQRASGLENAQNIEGENQFVVETSASQCPAATGQELLHFPLVIINQKIII